jgi:hypothetical protein
MMLSRAPNIMCQMIGLVKNDLERAWKEAAVA